jgi:hypothetical protein
MRKTNLTLLILIPLLCSLTACTDKKHFRVSGKLTDAAGSVLYFEKDGLLKTQVLDSCVLKADGSFSFKTAKPMYPEFYRLRLKNSDILFAADSCEQITINTSAKTMMKQYDIEGSISSSKIKQLRLSLFSLQATVDSLLKVNGADKQNAVAGIDSAITRHKKLAEGIILQNPLSTAAYYAIYQKLNDYLIFSPFDKADRRYCAAVATSYHNFYPKSERSLSLYNFVLQAIVADRQARNEQTLSQMVQAGKAGLIDVQLPNSRGQNIKLSGLKGKVVLLDFFAFQIENSSDYVFALRDMYNKYHAKGFEIYQISLDENMDVWNAATADLPWISVHALNGTPAAVVSYNVTQVPTSFLIGRSGDVIKRNPTQADVQRVIEGGL